MSYFELFVKRQRTPFRAKDYRKCLSLAVSKEEMEELRRHERTGRPLGSDRFVDKLEDDPVGFRRYKTSGERKQSTTNEYGVSGKPEFQFHYGGILGT